MTLPADPGRPDEPDRPGADELGEASGGTNADVDADVDAAWDHETKADVEAERALLVRAIGGWRGLFDSGVPAAVFVLVYLISGAVTGDSNLALALWLAIASGVVVAIWRLLRRESLQQVFAGFVGLGVSAFVASRTGRAEDFFLPGILLNLAYGTAFLVSILIRWPLLGVVIGFITGEGLAWRSDRSLRRAYAAASWIWVGVFGLRLLIQVPLYLAGAVGPLGVARIILGWPLFLAAAYLSYRVLRPALAQHRERVGDRTPDSGDSPLGQ